MVDEEENRVDGFPVLAAPSVQTNYDVYLTAPCIIWRRGNKWIGEREAMEGEQSTKTM